uniref:uncharacterized protein LOC122582382 n=1 Tax=Erigeron canadensis TaxID=72917 RepID=UPI001CB990D1|nr:uncharacterized protein LOC122582382 [Erigeron canadensis]
MELIKDEKQVSYDLIYDRIPPLSSKYPWFIAQNLDAKDDDDQIFYSIHSPLSTQYRCRIPELIGREIQACYHGWLILCRYPDQVMWSLWNPITCRLISLPPLKAHEEGDVYECCLSSPPDDPSSIFLLAVMKKPIIFFCRLDCKRKKLRLRWTRMSYAKQLKSIHVTDDSSDDDEYLYCLTCWNDKVYGCTFPNDSFVIQIDIVVKVKEVVISLVPIVRTPSPFTRCPQSYVYMLGCSTELFFIHIGFEDVTAQTVSEVFLFTLDMTNMMWEEIEDLKGAILFYNEDSVTYRPELGSDFGGGYIHYPSEMGQVINSYNVRSRTILLSHVPFLFQTRKGSPWTVLFECSPDDHQQGEDMNDATAVRSSVREPKIGFYSTTDEIQLLGIPFDLLERIIKLCVGVDYMNFRAASRCCRLAAPPIQWSQKAEVSRLRTYSLVSPWLTVFDKDQGIITFTDSISSDKYFIKTPTELIGDFQICCSRYGWLLMLKDDGLMVLYNPFTRDIRKLPEAPFDSVEDYCFSAPPTSPICTVVGFDQPDVWAVYLVNSEEEWCYYKVDFGCYDQCPFHFLTLYGQNMYGLSDDGGIHVIRKSVEEYLVCFRAEPPRSTCKSTHVIRFLATCDQHLIQVVMDELGESIELFNLDVSKMEWMKIDNLGKHMIYVCGTTCLCVEARKPEMENKVYFPRLRSKKIVFYSLETCRYDTFNNGENNIEEESFSDFFQTEYHTYRSPHAWIEPRWS